MGKKKKPPFPIPQNKSIQPLSQSQKLPQNQPPQSQPQKQPPPKQQQQQNSKQLLPSPQNISQQSIKLQHINSIQNSQQQQHPQFTIILLSNQIQAHCYFSKNKPVSINYLNSNLNVKIQPIEDVLSIHQQVCVVKKQQKYLSKPYNQSLEQSANQSYFSHQKQKQPNSLKQSHNPPQQLPLQPLQQLYWTNREYPQNPHSPTLPKQQYLHPKILYTQQFSDFQQRQQQDYIQAQIRQLSSNRIVCTCQYSQCLKMYCLCLANNKSCCKFCQCLNCKNIYVNQGYNIKIQLINDHQNKFIKCKCKKNMCQKNYCDCKNNFIKCSSSCQCVNCHNNQQYQDQNRDLVTQILQQTNPHKLP